MLESEFSERFGLSIPSLIRSGLAKYYGDLLLIQQEVIQQEGGTSRLSTGLCQPYWCRDRMDKPLLIKFDSVKDASDALRSLQRSWAPYSYTLFRRTSLIQDKLPRVNLKEKAFPFSIPSSPIGLYTLTGENQMIASASTSSPLPAGQIQFKEDHDNPPSRAYLKIQEALCVAASSFSVSLPGPGSRCFDAGACPGGWTWVLTQLGSDVFAVDRSTLDQSLMDNPHVQFMKHDAFTLPPQELGAFDWVFSDVICYPERLLDWIEKWLASGLTKNMICTIKMQGAVDWALVSRFDSIPQSRVLHLNYNKHELTFISCGRG